MNKNKTSQRRKNKASNNRGKSQEQKVRESIFISLFSRVTTRRVTGVPCSWPSTTGWTL